MEDLDRTKEELIKELAGLRKNLAELKERESAFKRVEEEIHERLVEYEKISALGRLTANVAHEIRNPITIIGGLARRLKAGVSAKTKEKEYLELIVLEAGRLENILREVLTFSQKGNFHREEYIINGIIDELLRFFETVCYKHSITIHKSFIDDIPKLYIDKKQFKEAIRNVISNAIDAMPDGGELTITTDKVSLNDKNYVVLKITDSGVGIPEENTLMIFEPFFTTKVTKKETGLGLSITKKIIERHGGFIEVDSKVGKGSAFSLYFPYRSE